jgi:hypothetical protein
MSRNNSKDIRERVRKKKGRKKPPVFRNDTLTIFLRQLVEKPEFAHLKPQPKKQNKQTKQEEK